MEAISSQNRGQIVSTFVGPLLLYIVQMLVYLTEQVIDAVALCTCIQQVLGSCLVLMESYSHSESWVLPWDAAHWWRLLNRTAQQGNSNGPQAGASMYSVYMDGIVKAQYCQNQRMGLRPESDCAGKDQQQQ
jgi:hypothetical protein